ncbi:MAG: hypothetical protein ACODAB_02095 [Gemmatimonadota bacterium]
MRSRIRTDVGRLRSAAAPAALAIGLLFPACLAAQEIRFDPRPDQPEERRLDTFLEGDYVLIETDTTLGPETRIEGNLLVLEADVRISGSITGDVAAVGADLFLRPGASIGGGILSLGGGLYASSRAAVAGDVTWRPNEVYLVRRDARAIRILPVRDVPEALTLHGLSGILFPGYQRVDEWTLGLGATVRRVEWDWQPSLEARVRLKTERGDLEGSLRHAWVPTSALQFGVEAERTSLTNEGWVRGEVANSLSFLFAGDDFRNYYEADRFALFLRGTETARFSPIVEIEWEEARSLEATDQFVLLASDDAVPNPPIDAGEIVSARVGLDLRRQTVETRLRTTAFIEAADSSAAGDFSYVLGDVSASWSGPALIGHGVEGYFMLRGDLSGDLPRQRWTSVGGLATLPRVPLLSERGARFAYGQVTYLIPVERLRLGLLGPPRLFLRAASGAAWNPGESAGFETNLSAGIRLFVFELAVAADPGASDLDPAVYATLRFPGDL